MGFMQRLLDSGSDARDDDVDVFEDEDRLFDDPADVTPAAPVPPAPVPPVPPVSPLPTAAPAAPATLTAYADMGLRYVLKTEAGEQISRIDDYERKLARDLNNSVVGVTVEQILDLQVKNHTLYVELFYLDSETHEPVKPVDNPELRQLCFADYDRQLEPPKEEPPAPAEPPKPDALVAAFAAMSDEDRKALLDLLQGSKSADPVPPSPQLDPPAEES